jgi:hypothetical protein
MSLNIKILGGEKRKNENKKENDNIDRNSRSVVFGVLRGYFTRCYR